MSAPQVVTRCYYTPKLTVSVTDFLKTERSEKGHTFTQMVQASNHLKYDFVVAEPTHRPLNETLDLGSPRAFTGSNTV